VVNKLLSLLEEAGTKVVILLQGKFPQTLCNLMMFLREQRNVNPEKNELVLFTRKYKIPSLTLLKRHQTRLTLCNQTKYLGVILDKKLNWTDIITDRTRKAAIALCTKAIGRNEVCTP